MIVVANWGCELFGWKLFVFYSLFWGRMPEFCASARGTIPFSSCCYGLKDKWRMAYAQVSRHVHWNFGQHQEVLLEHLMVDCSYRLSFQGCEGFVFTFPLLLLCLFCWIRSSEVTVAAWTEGQVSGLQFPKSVNYISRTS